jgi:outer membrane immunogenic protein
MRFVLVALAAGAVVGANSGASAADTPGNWTGWYGGVNTGYGSGTSNDASNDNCAESGSGFCTIYVAAGGHPPVSLKAKGFIGGGQVGYNWQGSKLIWGLEADLQGSGIKASATETTAPPGFITGTTTLEHELRWFGTVRGRLGFPASNWLFYGTGGLIYGRVSSSLTFSQALSTGNGSSSTTRTGWTLGAGMEIGLGARWTTKLEYHYFDLGRDSVTAVSATPGFVGDAITVSQEMAGHILRAGLNYRF